MRQKETIGLLSIGTFLEYFDLMLYIHMAVLLNELFFPQSDLLTTQLIAAFTLCSTYFMRPIGGLVIGYIGDKIGRKPTIFITTFIMACSCLAIANLKTYAEIGITASVIMILCRMLQGFSSMGEVVGAELYLAETLKSPQRYIYGGIIDVSASLGGLVALTVASFSISIGLNWRLAFLFGALIAIVGVLARTRIRETPEFIDYKRRLKALAKQSGQDIKTIENSAAYKEKTNKQSILAYFLIRLTMGVCFYTTYIYMGDFMEQSLNFSAEQVIHQNTIATFCTTVGMIIVVFLMQKFHPMKIAKTITLAFIVFLPIIPWWIENVSNALSLSCLQFVMFAPVLCLAAMGVVCFKHFPIAKRFTIIAVTFGIASAIGKIVVTFGIIPLKIYFGHYNLWIVYIPTITGFLWGISYIIKLEIKKGIYNNYPDEDFTTPDTAAKEEDFEYDLGEEYKVYNLKCEYAEQLLNRLTLLNNEVKRKINIKLVEKAIIFAKKWHDGQYRNTGEPFYSHPLAVAGLLAERYLKTDVIVAAILHDVVEDTECTLQLIKQTFNSRVAQIVERMTKVGIDDDGNITKQSIDETINFLYQTEDNETLFLKQHDRLHNLRTISGMSEEKQKKIAGETISSIMPSVVDAAEKLNIKDKIDLEEDIFTTSNITLKKKPT